VPSAVPTTTRPPRRPTIDVTGCRMPPTTRSHAPVRLFHSRALPSAEPLASSGADAPAPAGA
jgi:hypothetical protein